MQPVENQMGGAIASWRVLGVGTTHTFGFRTFQQGGPNMNNC